MIALLRRSGMPLAEIRAFLRDPTVERLEDYERRAVDEFAERRRVFRHVKRILKEEPMYDVLTKQVGEQAYVSRSRRVRVPELETYIFSMFEELGERDDARRSCSTTALSTLRRMGPVEVCVPKATSDKRLPTGEVAFTEISGSQCDFPEILGAYEAVYRWAKEHDREVGGPPREIYLNANGEELRMEIALPLR